MLILKGELMYVTSYEITTRTVCKNQIRQENY